jgi:hypothetical protein
VMMSCECCSVGGARGVLGVEGGDHEAISSMKST